MVKIINEIIFSLQSARCTGRAALGLWKRPLDGALAPALEVRAS